MSENWNLQVSPKLPDGTLINLRAENPEQMEQQLNWLYTKADAIAKAIGALNATQNVAQQLGGQTVSVQTQPQASWSSQGSQQQAPAFAQQGGGGPQGGKTCIHGDMTYREGVSKTSQKPYKAYFCPAPRGTSNQCAPEFLR